MRTSRALRAAVGAAALSFAVCSAAVADDDDDDDGPARDLDCIGCVGTGDIAAGAVTGEKIAPGAVGFNRLSPAVITAIEEGDSLEPVTVTVDCRAGESLQVAIDNVRQGQLTTIVVTEGCREEVVIKKNDIILDGDPLGSGDPITRGNIGGITLDSAQRIVIRNLDIFGEGGGLRAVGGSAFLLKGATIVGRPSPGVSVLDGSIGIIEDSQIDSNGDQNAPVGGGILVDGGSSAVITGNEIVANAGDGILVANGSFARVEDNTIEFNGGRAVFSEANLKISSATVEANGNRIREDLNFGVLVEDGGVYKAGAVLSRVLPDNPLGFEEISAGITGIALLIRGNSFANLRQAKVTGEIRVTALSALEVNGDAEEPDFFFSTLEGDLNVTLMSLATLGSFVLTDDDCFRDETSFCD